MDYIMVWQRDKHAYKSNQKKKETDETDSINFIQSSLKSHPLWVTLYVYISKIIRAYLYKYKIYEEQITKNWAIFHYNKKRRRRESLGISVIFLFYNLFMVKASPTILCYNLSLEAILNFLCLYSFS